MADGPDQVTVFSAVATTLINTGPGPGAISSNFQGIDSFGKWLLISAMLMRRLEIFTVLVLLTPAYWKH